MVVAEALTRSEGPVVEGITGVGLGIAVLVVPGWVLGSVASRGGRDADDSEQALLARLAANSVAVHVLELPWTLWLAGRVLRSGLAGHQTQVYLWALMTCLVTPFVLGQATAWLARRRPDTFAARVAGFFGMSAAARHTNAWGALFHSHPPVSAYVRVVLHDGRRIYGFFGEKSYASSNSLVHDLYLEKVVEFIDGRFRKPFPQSAGFWIAGGEIATVEFFHKDYSGKAGEQEGTEPDMTDTAQPEGQSPEPETAQPQLPQPAPPPEQEAESPLGVSPTAPGSRKPRPPKIRSGPSKLPIPRATTGGGSADEDSKTAGTPEEQSVSEGPEVVS